MSRVTGIRDYSMSSVTLIQPNSCFKQSLEVSKETINAKRKMRRVGEICLHRQRSMSIVRESLMLEFRSDLGDSLFLSTDPPGPARILFEPLIAVKGQMLNLRCVVDEPGRPPAKTFRWWRGSHVQRDQSTFNWTIFPVSLEHRANFSCEAINEAGHGPSASVPIDVFGNPLLSYYFYCENPLSTLFSDYVMLFSPRLEKKKGFEGS